MTQASIDRRNMWAERIEWCLSSSMSIERWRKLNHVGRSSLYAWLARFREEEPGRFPRRNAATLNWIELTRGGLADSKLRRRAQELALQRCAARRAGVCGDIQRHHHGQGQRAQSQALRRVAADRDAQRRRAHR